MAAGVALAMLPLVRERPPERGPFSGDSYLKSGIVFAPYIPFFSTAKVTIPDLLGFVGKTFEPRHYTRESF